MDNSFEDLVSDSDSDNDWLDSSDSFKEATYIVISIDEINHKMKQAIEGVVSSTKVNIIEFILFFE